MKFTKRLRRAARVFLHPAAIRHVFPILIGLLPRILVLCENNRIELAAAHARSQYAAVKNQRDRYFGILIPFGKAPRAAQAVPDFQNQER